MITTQAKLVINALRKLGLPRSAFTVRTEGSGSAPQGFGEATAVIYSRAHVEEVYDRAEELVGLGVSVHRWTYGGRKYGFASSSYPPRVHDRGEIKESA